MLFNKLKRKVRQIKSEAAVLIVAYADQRTPLIAKIIIGFTIGYLLSPIDLIPDFIPVAGILDDLIIVPLLFFLSIRLIPGIVLAEARQYIKDNPQKLKRNNWIFAAGIILIWLLLLWFVLKYFGYL